MSQHIVFFFSFFLKKKYIYCSQLVEATSPFSSQRMLKIIIRKEKKNCWKIIQRISVDVDELMCSFKGKEELFVSYFIYFLFTSVFIMEHIFFMGFLSYFLWFDDGSMDLGWI